jgi:hypothetical protein
MVMMMKQLSIAKQIRIQRLQDKNRMVGSSFHTGTDTFKESPRSRALTVAYMEVDRWYAERHSHGDSQYARECIRESIQRLRDLKKEFTQ